MLFCLMPLIWVFGIILILVAIWMIIEGFETKDKRKIVGGAALGLGTAAGLKYLSDKQKEEKQKQLQAKAESDSSSLQKR